MKLKNKFIMEFGGHRLTLGQETVVMGILNVTPDSFSDGGEFFSIDKAVAHGEHLEKAGADIIDIGGESSRPYAKTVSEEDEINRVIPVIEQLARKVSVPISIDTRKANVARLAIESGASIVNDISALQYDSDMVNIVASHDVAVILMHMQKNPQKMQDEPFYEDVVKDIYRLLDGYVKDAVAKGISKSKIIIDPGIGFGKTRSHNLTLLKYLKNFTGIGVPILIGTSRKAFIRGVLKNSLNEDYQPDHDQVEVGTQASIACAAVNGAHIVRVHNVRNTKTTLSIVDEILGAA